MSRPRLRVLVACAVLMLLGPAGCTPEADQSSSAPAPSGADCTKEKLPLKAADRLTVGTDKPARQPWFVDDNPSNGQGYESAVAYAVAEQLGFDRAQVDWVVVPFDSSFAAGEKTFDFDINQVSITEERREAIDFSSGYYTLAQAVVTVEGSPIAGERSIADLTGAKLGAQKGTRSYAAITEQVKPKAKAAAFDTVNIAVQALKNRQVDGLVVDLPTAFSITGTQLDDAQIVGQLPEPGTDPDQFGLVLDQGSPLTGCVSQAVDTLQTNGTLRKLQSTWLDDAGAPQLR